MGKSQKNAKHRGNPSAKKQAKNAIEPKAKKHPPDREPKSFDGTYVQWSFKYFDNHEWFDGNHKTVPFTKIGNHMTSYERMTWAQIRRQKRDHAIEPDCIIPEAWKRLIALELNDYDELWRFRFGSEPRIWGLKIKSVFYVLWWDPQHKICPSPKKHT